MDAAERHDLLEQLVHPDDELRRLAVERTSLLRAEDALPLLAERLGDGSWRVRKAAISRLAALPERTPVVVALLEAIADGDDPGRRNAALEALIGCGRAATQQLVNALGSPDVDVRKQLVDVLGAIGDARAAAALTRALRDVDANVRAAAADALAAVGATCAAAELLAAVQADSATLVRAAALRALVQLEAPIPFPVIKQLLERPLLAAAAYAALGQSGEPEALGLALEGLLARRASARAAAAGAVIHLAARADDAVRFAANVSAFAAKHEDVVPDALARIEESVGEARLSAVQFAALLRAPSAAPAFARSGCDASVAGAAHEALVGLGAILPQALTHGWSQLGPAERAFACGALARCGAGAAAERMLRTALLDPSCEVRAAAARALATCATVGAFGELLGRLAHDDPQIARDAAEDEADALVEAVVALAEREGGEAADAVIALIEARLLHGGERARFASARLLAALARPADAARVRGLLTDPSPHVRSAAVHALPRLADGAEELLLVALGDESPSVRSAAARVVPRLGHAELDANLAALARDRAASVRAAAMSALAERAATPAARGESLALLASGVNGGGVVALAALDALQRLGGQDAAAIAAQALCSAEPEIVERAVACVGAHGGEGLWSQLGALLAHPAWPVRARAARELAAQRTAAAAPLLHARLGEERDEFVREALLAALAALES
jgi:HEAT repeat protein